MIANKRVLVIKLSPLKGLNSSMMRALAVVKGLVGTGYTVDMLTLQASASHVINQAHYDFMDKVNIIYANPNKAYSQIVAGADRGIKQKLVGYLRKIYHKFALFDYSESIARRIKKDILPSTQYEYIIAVSDPKTTHIAARELIRQGLAYNKLIEYWGDPLYGDITLKSIYPGFVYKWVEKRLLRIADRIVYTSPFTLEQEQRTYPMLADRMIYSPTAYLEEKILPKHEGTYTIGYYGAYPSNVRNILPLYHACSQMNGTVKLIIVGNSDLSLDETENIEIHPRGDISRFEAETDLFVCILNSSGTQIPGKLYHYAAYNRPVLVIEDGEYAKEMRDYIRSFNRYYTCKNEVADIEKSIKQIMKSNVQWRPFAAMDTLHVIKTILA